MPNEADTAPPPDNFQCRYARRWSHLTHPDVRALAWLLDAPDLLDPGAPQWQGKIATLGPHCASEAAPWLAALDAAPAPLETYLGATPFTRLGRYAEKLMAFYFSHQGILEAHGLQVRDEKNTTIGEFDFLLRDGDQLLHWEFATKFYLLEPGGAGQAADYFVGPNLADTLGAKMHKILDRQLALASHAAALVHLKYPVAAAQALVKGWLFYHQRDLIDGAAIGLSPQHNHGFWCALEEFAARGLQQCVVLPRLAWLAPASVLPEVVLDGAQLQAHLAAHFAHDSMPVMVAALRPLDGRLVETERGFIVPDDWRRRASERMAVQIKS